MFEGIDLLDPTKLVPEELAPVQPVGLLTLNANPVNFFAETEQVGLPPRTPRPRHRPDRRPAAAGPAVLLPGHPAHPARRPELRPAADQPPARAAQRHVPRRLPPDRRPRRASRRTSRTRLDGGVPVRGGPGQGRLRRGGPAGRGRQGAHGSGVVRRPLQPGPAVLPQPQRRGARPHHRRPHLRAGQVLRAGRSRCGCSACSPTSTPTSPPPSPRGWACPRPRRRWTWPTSTRARP